MLKEDMCQVCLKEIRFLKSSGAYPPRQIEAYWKYFGQFEDTICPLQQTSAELGLEPDEMRVIAMRVANWLDAYSPYRVDRPAICPVCDQPQLSVPT